MGQKIMKIYNAIYAISNSIKEDNLCEAIILKGSIGRGDDDEYSDVDMYAIVKEENYDKFLNNREKYLRAYNDIIYTTENNFGILQMLAIFKDGIHVDFYVTTYEKLPHNDPIRVYYDPNKLFTNYKVESNIMTKEQLAKNFEDALYYLVEANSAYCRKNYPWTAHIMNATLSCTAVLLRYLYDKEFAYLGLKKINQIIPKEQYKILEKASENLNKDGFQFSNVCILAILEFVLDNLEPEIKESFNLKFYDWIKKNININLFK